MIQIEKPVGWNKERVRNLAVGIKMIELYNSAAKQKVGVVRKKWDFVTKLQYTMCVRMKNDT